MDAVTYPEERIVAFIAGQLVPVRVPFDAQPLAREFKIKWTPVQVILDPEGTEHHRAMGFLAPDEFIPCLLLGIGKMDFDLDRYDESLAIFAKILADYPKSDSVAEAIYLAGVCRYKRTGDPKPLKETYERLAREYPGSEWTKRAAPYRLL